MPETPQRRLNVLALEPYYGGSHSAMLDAWVAESLHDWTLSTLPPYHWKWRMRHAAVTFADRLNKGITAHSTDWDVVFTCSMLDLATFRALAPANVAQLPTVLYFHENQLTYPVRKNEQRDLHFGLTNMTSALAAEEVWFNSAFHRDDFLGALDRELRRLPPAELGSPVEEILDRSRIEHPIIQPIAPREGRRKDGPLRIVWVARWEHDKNPEDFFDALGRLEERGVEFQVSVLGEQFKDAPPIFEIAKKRLGERILRWGYQSSREEYEDAIRECDVVVSTAGHEFFGIAVLEAISAGLIPLLPDRLAYPEVIATVEEGASLRSRRLYDGTPEDLADHLAGLADSLTKEYPSFVNGAGVKRRAELAKELFAAAPRAAAMDEHLRRVVTERRKTT
jgi:glycosyltransferase involved in cell wall biosynthesis